MTDEPLVSVIIPAYNAARSLPEAIQSVLQQSYRTFEILVVDDGSTDSTSAVARSFGERVRCARQENAGAGAARNRGMDLARGELLTFLDADDLYQPTKLEKQVRFLQTHPEHGGVVTDILNYFEDRPELRWVDSSWAEANTFETRLIHRSASWASLMLRTTCRERVRYFDTSLATAEDRHFLLRLLRHFPIGRVPEALYVARRRSGSLSGRVGDWPIRCLDKLVAEFPELHPDRFPPMRQAYRKLLVSVGKEHFWEHRNFVARTLFRRSIRMGFSAEALRAYLLACLPEPVCRLLFRFVRKRRERWMSWLEGWLSAK